MASEARLPTLRPIERLNSLPPDEFAAALRPLFEAAGPLAAALAAERPFRSYDELLDRATEVVEELPEAEQVAIVNAHPRIGESADAVRASSSLSYREQGYDAEAGLDREEVDRVYRELAALNQAYEVRFGFRFVVFVAGRPKSAIVPIMRQRLANGRSEELATALRDMVLIARDRLSRLMANE